MQTARAIRQTTARARKRVSEKEILRHEFLTIAEVAILLRVSERTVYNLIYQGTLRATKVTSRVTIIPKETQKTKTEATLPLSDETLRLCGERGTGQVFKGMAKSLCPVYLKDWIAVNYLPSKSGCRIIATLQHVHLMDGDLVEFYKSL